MLHRARVAGLCLATVLLLLAGRGLCQAGFSIAHDLPVQPCHNFTREFSLSTIHFYVNGTRVTAYPMSIDGTYIDKNTAALFQIQNITEQVRYPGNQCLPYSDPILQWVHLGRCSCTFLPVLEEKDGHKTEGFALRFSGCQTDGIQFTTQDSFIATVSYTTSNVTYEQNYTTTVPGSSAPSFTYTNFANGLKIGIQLQNWTYVSGIPYRDQYLSMLTYTGIKTSRTVSMLVTTDASRSYANFDYGDMRKVQMVTDSGIIFDGEPGLTPVETPLLRNITFPPTEDMYYYFHTPKDFCAPYNDSQKMTNWEDIFYDPSIVGLFTPGPSTNPVEPNSPIAKASKKVTVAVVVSVVCVIVLVIAVALVFTFVPAARHFVRPFTKRTDRASKTQTSTPDRRKSDWHTAQKPPNLN